MIIINITYDEAKRINLAGLIYHVICRADQDDVVFTNDKDKECFLEYSEKEKRD